MQNQNPNSPVRPQKLRGLSVVGFILLIAGLVMMGQLNEPAADRWFPGQLSGLLLLSPALLAVGGAMLLTGVVRSRRRANGSIPPMPSRGMMRLAKAWRVLIWIFTVATVFPWWWLGILTRLSGGRPGNEGEGLGGFLVMIFLGLPALLLAIITEVCIRRNRSRNN